MLRLNLSYKNTSNMVLKALLSSLCLLFILPVCILLFSSTFFCNTAYAEKSYIKCWKNSEGLTECGNRVPRQYYNQRVRYIDDKGVTRKIKEKAKTKKELDSEKEMEKLQALESDQQRKSVEYDAVLLKTYLTIDDLLTSMNSKLAIINSSSNILQGNLELKKRQFGNLVRQAANMERSGKQISTQLATKLDASRSDLRNLQSQITKEERDVQHIKKTFAYDVERFMLSKANTIKNSLTTPSQAKKLHAVRLNCLTKSQCDLHRKKANAFIKEFATTKFLYETDKISVTDSPVRYQDIAMGLVLLDTETGEQKIIIFQIRCNLERVGQEFCNGNEVNGLLKEFKSVVYSKENPNGS